MPAEHLIVSYPRGSASF